MKTHIVSLVLGLSLIAISAHAEISKCTSQDGYVLYVTSGSKELQSNQNVLIANPALRAADPVVAHFRADKNDIELSPDRITLKVDLRVGEQGSRSNKTVFEARLSTIHDIHIFLAQNGAPISVRADFRPGRSRAEPYESALSCTPFSNQDLPGEELHEAVVKDLRSAK